MAINVTKQPSGIYPAYNDSFIEFTSDLTGHNKAEITVFPISIFSRVFVVYPDLEGNYLSNLKEAVKVIFNANGFKDDNFFTFGYWQSISGIYLLQQIEIKVLSDSDSETLLKSFEFYKAVKQIGEPINENQYQLLTYTPDGINHSMTYFEGFPFHFDIQRIMKEGEEQNEFTIVGIWQSEAFTASSSWRTEEVAIEGGQTIQYKLYSTNTANLLTYFDIYNNVISYILAAALPTTEPQEGIVTAPSNAVKVAFTTFNAEIEDSWYKIFELKPITIKSLNTGNVSEEMTPTVEGAFRINVDRGGGDNWTTDNVLALIEGLNRLEIYSNGTFKSNLLLTKRKKCSGVYLKWWNRNGGFSHYLFDEFFVSQLKTKEIGKVFNDEFSNINEATGNNRSIGKEGSGTLTVKAKYEDRDYENLKDIFSSPYIQMYTSRQANVEGYFIDVSVDGTISNSNKKGKNEINLIIDLPEFITAKL